MSYDLEWAVLPEPAASAKARYDSCDWLGDPPCPHGPPCLDAYEALAAPYRFHATVLDMGWYIDGMRRAGMCFDAEPSPFTGRQYTVREWEAAGPAERQADAVARDRFEAQRVPGRAGIPVFKLSSNGPWRVTVEEIDAALDAYAGVPAELRGRLESQDHWPSWVEWLRTCRGHGGFRLE